MNKKINKNEIIVCFVPSLKWRMSSGAQFVFSFGRSFLKRPFKSFNLILKKVRVGLGKKRQ